MAYCLEPNENPADGLKRIALEQLDQALENASNPAMDRDEAIHDVRKRMKKLRAVLRMARDELGEKVYKSENACYREAAKHLAGLREVAVQVATVENLKSYFSGQTGVDAFDPLLANLQEQVDAVHGDDPERKSALADVADLLRAARGRAKDWPIKARNFSAMAKGVRGVYRRGRKGLRTVTKAASDNNFHEWRKSAKYLWYHARILEASWPAMMSALVAELDILGDALGADHDLADLRATLSGNPELSGGAPELQTVMGFVSLRQDELRSAALALGKRIYAEKPAAFADRLEVYWYIARASTPG